MVKLVDTPDLGSGTERCGGSSPFTRSLILKFLQLNKTLIFLLILFLSPIDGGVQKRPKQFRILLAGDVMFDWGLRETMVKRGFYSPIENLVPIFDEADLKMFNLETPISTYASPDPTKSYVFNAKPDELNLLNRLDVDMVFLANNHTMDYGKEGLAETIRNLSIKGILYAGAGMNSNEAFLPKKINFKNYQIQVSSASAIGETRLFATTQLPGAAAYSVPRLTKIPKKGSDIFEILSLHWGVEYNPEPTKEQIEGAHKLIDSGFHVIAGHHPHIPQGIEKYNDGLIIYSMGNFIFGSQNQYLNHNIAIMLTVQNNRLITCEIIPIFGKFQKDEHIIYPLVGEQANNFLEEISYLSQKLNTRIIIRNGRGYIYF